MTLTLGDMLRDVLSEMILLRNHFGVSLVPSIDYISTAKTFKTRSDQDLFNLYVRDILRVLDSGLVLDPVLLAD